MRPLFLNTCFEFSGAIDPQQPSENTGFLPDHGSKEQRNNSANNSEITAAKQRDNSEDISDKKATDQRLIRNATPCNALTPGTHVFLHSELPQDVDGRAKPATGGFA